MVNENIIVALITAFPPSLLAFLAWRTGISNSKGIQDVHISVNGKMEALLESTKRQATAEGSIQGAKEANKRTDELKKPKL